jgi:hypothetical protein
MTAAPAAQPKRAAGAQRIGGGVKTFKAQVKAGNSWRDTTIQAKTSYDAKKLLEGQYGVGNVRNVQEVR